MEDKEFVEDDIDWENLVTELVDPSSSFEIFTNPSPDGSENSRIGEVENLLMTDNYDDLPVDYQSLDDFFYDILVDLHSPASGVEVVGLQTDKDSNGSDGSRSASPKEEEEKVNDGPEVNISDNNDNDNNENNNDANDYENADDPISKKRRRIPAVGFPALVPGHHVPVYSAHTDPIKSGVSSTVSSGRKGFRKSGSKRSRK